MQLAKAYEPGRYEADIYALWEKQGVFKPSKTDKTFSIVMPPPNANGNLHMGHELTGVLEDIAARYHRLKGEATLLLPGADHAGFETQVVYEKQLARTGQSRFDFGRDELYGRIYDFVAANRGNFEAQLRRIGVSCDWTRFTFTLDKPVVDKAYATFKTLWDDGLVYRGERLVNFCTFHGTAFADVEVAYKAEAGRLWHLRYPLVDGSGEIVVATTRPETMLGDTAVAVNPSDKRYRKSVGKTVRLPLTRREIPVIADDFVEPGFGSGAVKITPAHDPNDFEVGRRHDLPMPTVIGFDGKMADVPEQYRGLTVAEARRAIVRDLEDQGAVALVEDYDHHVGHCYKCGTVIQPLLKDQWFVDMQPLAKPAIAALKAGRITFYPAAKRDQLIGYLEGLRDWNISRQIAWGIPIPAFQNIDQPDDWIFDERTDVELIRVGGKTYRRDPDVFDTWFSSSSWPYATLDWPGGDDFRRFYPLSLMETGGEILYPWVSRMIMLGLYNTGEVPFEAVYIHGYVMAEDGSKMSKSVGNVVDPMPVIERFGSDALRLGIVQGRAAGVNRGYDPRKVEDGRNFCNKLWNIARYAQHALGDDYKPGAGAPSTIADHWVLSKLQHTAELVSAGLDAYRFAEAYDRLYHFVWDELADWYVEASKQQPNRDLLARILSDTLRLAHPFAPFVTETIWQTFAWGKRTVLAADRWPGPLAYDQDRAGQFDTVRAVVSEARYLSKALQADKPTLYYGPGQPVLAEQGELIARLARLGAVAETAGGSGVSLVAGGVDAWLDISAAEADAYRERLTAKHGEAEQQISQLEGRLANERYVANAPSAVVEQTRQQLNEATERLHEIERERGRFTA